MCRYKRGYSLKAVFVSKKYLYIKEIVCIGDGWIGRTSVLERCLDWGDVCIREMSVLERCVYWRPDCIREMFALKRCLY